MYGPPGTGKSLLAKACANECKATFFSISASDILDKLVGGSEKALKKLFNDLKQYKPSILFLDEIDSIASKRSDSENSEASNRVKTELLVQMQACMDDQDILILGATNRPYSLDTAVRRRFEKRIMIPLPDYEAREYLLKKSLEQNNHSLSLKDFQQLAKLTNGYSCADLTILVREAVYEPLRQCQESKYFKKIDQSYFPANKKESNIIQLQMTDIPPQQLQLNDIQLSDFKIALKKIKPSVSQEDIDICNKFTLEFGEEA